MHKIPEHHRSFNKMSDVTKKGQYSLDDLYFGADK